MPVETAIAEGQWDLKTGIGVAEAREAIVVLVEAVTATAVQA